MRRRNGDPTRCAFALTPIELTELWLIARATRRAISAAFSPDHYNYMFLMNQDAHVHLHVVPLYYRDVAFEGYLWQVLATLDGAQRPTPSNLRERIATVIGDQLRSFIAEETTVK